MGFDIIRKNTRSVRVGGIFIGGDAPISIQSMTNTTTADTDATIAQINALKNAGCDIVRVTVPDAESAKALRIIKDAVDIPVVADIHFDYKLAIKSIENGADKIRINPGNIGGEEKIKAVCDCANSFGVPIRVGVNSGSLEKDLLEKYDGVTPEGLCESAINKCELMEKYGFSNIVVSIKASDVFMCVEANRLFSKKSDRPLHLGITEAGTLLSGSVKSSVGLSSLLFAGIGDTIRISLSADPIEEVRAARVLLSTLALKSRGVDIVSCPTCGRTKIDVIGLAEKVTKLTEGLKKDIKIAVMGCAVNGPGEAREADLGIAGGNGEGLIFAKGEIIKKVPEDKLLEELMQEIEKI